MGTVHGLYPKGETAGLQSKDLGEETLTDAEGGLYQGYLHHKWDCGLAVRDRRQIVRIANVNVQTLTKDAASRADLVDLMTAALETAWNLRTAKFAFYCKRAILSFLRRQIKNDKNINLNLERVAGKKVVHFDGIPVRRPDSVLLT